MSSADLVRCHECGDLQPKFSMWVGPRDPHSSGDVPRCDPCFKSWWDRNTDDPDPNYRTAMLGDEAIARLWGQESPS